MVEQSFTRDAARAGPPAVLANRLGYLLKHAQLRLADLGASALAPFGISGRECAVLIVIDDAPPLSQLELARQMGVDRTTMVALIDLLEAKALVARHPDPHDRRRNVIALTDSGRTTLRKARSAHDHAEERFLDGLSEEDSAHLKRILRAVIVPVPDDKGRDRTPER